MVTHNMQHAVDFGHSVIMLDAGKSEIADLGRGKGQNHRARPDRPFLGQDRPHAARELIMDFIQNIFSTFVSLIPVTLAQSLILAFVVLGIMIPFRTLNFPDLTSEGAFPLGGCVCGVLLAAGAGPVTAIMRSGASPDFSRAAAPPSSICGSASTRCLPAS
jgi:hypothetical protein